MGRHASLSSVRIVSKRSESDAYSHYGNEFLSKIRQVTWYKILGL
jgi:hypothetical protein